ncbi:aromatic acid exporter family protein [Bacillaceae bacterium S4-13-58]
MLTNIRRIFPFGSRTIKTGISVFFTSLLCMALDFPVIFAVITAIVTVENTAANSVKKALIRFPASALGAFIAVSLYGWLGITPLTYALATILTIGVCYKLKLYDGILVATITAVAMIPGMGENYFVDFFIRLATTTIGIVVSSAVNFVLLPPNYLMQIQKSSSQNFRNASLLFKDIVRKHFQAEEQRSWTELRRKSQNLTESIDRNYRWLQYQREEWKYHKYKKEEAKEMQLLQHKLHVIRQVAFHIGNLNYIKISGELFDASQKQLILKAVDSICDTLSDSEHSFPNEHFDDIYHVDLLFWEWRKGHTNIHSSSNYHHHFAPEIMFLYEILCIHDLSEELYTLEKRHQTNKRELPFQPT